MEYIFRITTILSGECHAGKPFYVAGATGHRADRHRFHGPCHALAFGNANAALDLPARIRLTALADADSVRAEQCASAWGFDHSHADWQHLISDPQVQIVAITTPNHLHFPMAMAAIAAGKAVYCEKPLAVSLAQADDMRRSAKAAGVVTQVGYNYQHNPMIGLAREMANWAISSVFRVSSARTEIGRAHV